MNEFLKSELRNIPDFPKPGIQFKDINSWLEDPECIKLLNAQMCAFIGDKQVSRIACIESRGFILGSIMAWSLGVPVTLIRKEGKLPGSVVKETYEKEYGPDTIEIQEGAIKEGDVVIIHDDILATGGTAYAAWKLVQKFKPAKVIFIFLFELTGEGLEGRKFLEENTDSEVWSVVEV